jgi:hypothetical protein
LASGDPPDDGLETSGSHEARQRCSWALAT